MNKASNVYPLMERKKKKQYIAIKVINNLTSFNLKNMNLNAKTWVSHLISLYFWVKLSSNNMFMFSLYLAS